MQIFQKTKYTFIVIGLILLVIAFVSFKNTLAFTEHAVSTTGKVTQVVRKGNFQDYSFSPVIRFYNQKNEAVEFVSLESSKVPEYKVGDEVPVIYQPSMPKEAIMNRFFSIWGVTLMFGYIGIFSLLVGVLPSIWSKYKTKKVQRLLCTGNLIQAEIQGIYRNKNLKIQGNRSYQIHAQWLNPETQKIHIFKSDNIWFNPTCYVQNDKIQVYINKNNLKEYYVDISFLPKLEI